MKRVQQTFAPSAKHHPVKQVILPGLREIDFGDWTGFGYDALRKKFRIQPWEWLEQIELGIVPNGESTVHFRKRVETMPAPRHPRESWQDGRDFLSWRRDSHDARHPAGFAAAENRCLRCRIHQRKPRSRCIRT